MDGNKVTTKPAQDQDNNYEVFVSKKGHSFLSRKILIWSGIVVIVLCLIGLVIYLYLLSSQKPKPVISSCTNNSSLLNNASKAIISNNITSQSKIVNQIKKIPNYQKDPNCLYIMTSYYINTSNASEASSYLNKLEKIFNTSKGFSSKLSSLASLNDIKSEVSAMNYNAAQAKNFVITTGPPKQ